jgi:hypothetical protein
MTPAPPPVVPPAPFVLPPWLAWLFGALGAGAQVAVPLIPDSSHGGGPAQSITGILGAILMALAAGAAAHSGPGAK